jgi:hypothetical protein
MLLIICTVTSSYVRAADSLCAWACEIQYVSIPLAYCAEEVCRDKKVKLSLSTPWRRTAEVDVYFHSFSSSALGGCMYVVKFTLRPLCSRERIPGSFEYEVMWAPERVWFFFTEEKHILPLPGFELQNVQRVLRSHKVFTVFNCI